jgi:nucleotide-binding universal stress UspA family protein
MYKHILLPTDGSDLSERAIASGIKFAKSINARVTGFFASPDPGTDYFIQDWRSHDPKRSPRELEEAGQKLAQKVLSKVQQQARSAGVECECVSVVSDSPHEAIIAAATEKGCDLIFMASHGRRGFSGVLLGSETIKVLTYCKIPVLVYR